MKTAFIVLLIILLLYVTFIVLFSAWFLVTRIRFSLDTETTKSKIITSLSKHYWFSYGGIKAHTFLSILALISGLILFVPLFDSTLGPNWIAHFEGDTLVTPFGSFADGKAFLYAIFSMWPTLVVIFGKLYLDRAARILRKTLPKIKSNDRFDSHKELEELVHH